MFQSTPSGGKATNRGRTYFGLLSVSIHAFRGEGDLLPMRPDAVQLVSIHAFRGEGDTDRLFRSARGGVSIHAFRGEGDRPARRHHHSQSRQFQSTPSGGKATWKRNGSGAVIAVSIHAFRGEGDLLRYQQRASFRGFNPRLPGGRRR